METKEEYKARIAKAKANGDMRKWWFRQSDPINRFTGWLVTWTALLFVGTIISAGIFGRQLFVMQGTLDEIQKEFYFVHRPHIRVRFAIVDHAGEKMFESGKFVDGSIDVLNNGQTDAAVIGSDLEVYWSNTGLPNCFPQYCQGKMTPNQFVCTDTIRQSNGTICTIEVGSRKNGKIHSSIPLPPEAENIETGADGWKIYLLGWITYRGRDETNIRNFDFAELYDAKKYRFFPITDDPDYAYDPDKN